MNWVQAALVAAFGVLLAVLSQFIPQPMAATVVLILGIFVAVAGAVLLLGSLIRGAGGPGPRV